MTKWHTIETKFTEEEWNHVSKYMKKYGIKNASQLVRLALEDRLGLSISDARRTKPSLPAEYLSVYNFYEQYRKELVDSPEQLKKFEASFSKWKDGFFREYIQRYNIELGKANKMWTAFREHKQIGRPKEEKKARGRPEG